MLLVKISIDIIQLFFSSKKQRRVIKKTLLDKNVFKSPLNEVFTKSELRLLENYALNVYLGLLEPFCFLLGRKPSQKENQQQILLCIYACIQDNLIDSSNTQFHKQKLELLHTIEKYIIDNVAQKEVFVRYYHKVLVSQMESKKQFDANITIEQIQEISFNKCGSAFLLVRSILSEPISKEETEAIFQYGGAAQIGDDILDLFDDISIGQNTLANRTELASLSILFNTEFFRAIQSFYDLKYPRVRINKTITRIIVFLSVFNLGLKQYHKLQIDPTNWTAIKNLPRKAFILDMEKFKTKLDFSLNAIKLHKQIRSYF